MTDFNALPLAEQLKALQPGDELHLRGGGWLPFVEYGYAKEPVMCAASLKIMITHDTEDIIRVHRPTARKVLEVVEKMRALQNSYELVPDSKNTPVTAYGLAHLCKTLADHFEETP